MEYIRNAAKAAKELGIRVEGIWNCYFTEKEGNEVLRLSQEITSRLSAHGVGVGGKIMFQGTAAEVLSEYALKQPWTRYNKCHEESGQLRSLSFISIDPYGYVQPCSGISIGNAKEKKLSEIIKSYDPQAHPILGPLCAEGPTALAKMAMAYGFKPTEYADDCHLCYEARKVLLEHYREYLAPSIWYKKTKTGLTKTHAISGLGKLYQYVDLKGKTLDALLLAARDPDESMRRAAIFALEDCISDETRDKIFICFEGLLEDGAKTVKYGALEALTEVLPHKINNKAFDRILGFLKADEQWVRWRVALALNKAYPELDAGEKKKAVSVLTELIKDEDIFVKVRAYEAFLNIKDLEKKSFPEVDEALKEEEDFVQQWVLWGSEQR